MIAHGGSTYGAAAVARPGSLFEKNALGLEAFAASVRSMLCKIRRVNGVENPFYSPFTEKATSAG